MYGPARIFWAKLPPSSRRASAGQDAEQGGWDALLGALRKVKLKRLDCSDIGLGPVGPRTIILWKMVT
jgi:hypothetical protein